jgi:hypothetical protein
VPGSCPPWLLNIMPYTSLKQLGGAIPALTVIGAPSIMSRDGQ